MGLSAFLVEIRFPPFSSLPSALAGECAYPGASYGVCCLVIIHLRPRAAEPHLRPRALFQGAARRFGI